MALNPRIQLIHAVTAAKAPIHGAFARLWPEAETGDIDDLSLPGDLAAAGSLTGAFTERMAGLIERGVKAGADAILFTCSAFGGAIEAARQGVAEPVLKSNEAMIGRALSLGACATPRIGGLATFAPTLASLKSELLAAAEATGIEAKINLRHVPGALGALNAGDGPEHDRLLAAAAGEMTDCDCLLLAQFSMIGAKDAIQDVPARPVLTAPDEAVKKLKRLLGAG
jgi:hypothetical protein